MLRITLNKPYRVPVSLRYGFDTVTPMDHGTIAPELTNEFRGPRTPSGSTPRIWTMDYHGETKSILVSDAVATLYFGDPRATSADHEAVQMKRIPEFNNERERVANCWGGYHLSDKHGTYAIVRIAVPDVPDVTIHHVNDSGSVVGEWVFEPLKFWKFEDLLHPDAEAEMAEILAKRGKRASSKLNIADIPADQLDELADLLEKRKKLVTAGAK